MKKPAFLLLFALVTQFTIAQGWDWGGPIDPLQANYKVTHYRLELELLPETQSIKGSNTITFSAKEKLDTIRLNLIDEYQVDKVLMDGKEVRFSHQNDILDIIPVDCTCDQVQVFYGGKTPIAQNPPWEGGFTWEKDQLDNHWMGLSAQAEGSKIFMPAWDHPSNEPENGIDIILTAPKPYFVASNGRLIDTKESDGKIIQRIGQGHKKACENSRSDIRENDLSQNIQPACPKIHGSINHRCAHLFNLRQNHQNDNRNTESDVCQ